MGKKTRALERVEVRRCHSRTPWWCQRESPVTGAGQMGSPWTDIQSGSPAPLTPLASTGQDSAVRWNVLRSWKF